MSSSLFLRVKIGLRILPMLNVLPFQFLCLKTSLPKHRNSLIFCCVIQPYMHKNNLNWHSGTIA